MRMPGAADDLYVRARRVLLDVLEALADHRNAIVLVGAQAIYLHVGEADFAVAPFTADSDLVLNPEILADAPEIDALLRARGFAPSPDRSRIGAWLGPDGIPVDLMVPEALAGRGRRRADLGPQGTHIARRARGLEAALVDSVDMVVDALDPSDRRRTPATVAGPTALLIAKLHKIYERRDNPTRLNNKDAFDVYRLLAAIPTETFGATLPRLLRAELSRDISLLGVSYLRELFGRPDAVGSQMAGRAVELVDDPARIALSCAYLADDLLSLLEELDRSAVE
jgi:hypothetical protein